jgi:Protein of unknown function (DUF1329)
MRSKILGMIGGIALLGLPSLGMAQSSTDISDLKQFMSETENQGTPPAPGTKITMANWQQYKAFLPFGMTKLFQGTYQLKMPNDVEIDIGETKVGGNLPPTFLAATEKYSGQNSVSVTPDGHYDLQNYQGGIPFPNPSDPHKGWKGLANVFFAYAPAIIASTPENVGTIWFADRFGNISADTFDLVYRQSGYNSDPGIPVDENYAPGTWYTQWFMEETPEQARYTASLALFFKDQESHPFPDQYVFVPALRRSLRLSTSARCAPIFGSDWANDDAKLNGFNGSTSIYDADFLSDRKEVELLDPAMKAGYQFPNDYYMPLGFPKPDWGAWQVRPAMVIDVHRVPSEASGYCYGDRVMYLDKEIWSTYWNDNFDSNHKLWKIFAYENAMGDIPDLGHTWVGIGAMAWDVQNTHMTIWSSWGNHAQKTHFFDNQVPGEYRNGIKYGSPSGLMQIMR